MPTFDSVNVDFRDEKSAAVNLRKQGTKQALLDSLMWVVGVAAATLLQHDVSYLQASWGSVLVILLAAIVLQILIGSVFRLYPSRFLRGSFDEIRSLALATSATGLIVSLLALIAGRYFEVQGDIAVVAAPIAFILMLGIRFLGRADAENPVSSDNSLTPILVYGTGYVGSRLIERLITDTASPYRIVGLVDDAPAKKNQLIRGCRVLGTIDELPVIAEQTGASVIAVAIAEPGRNLMRRVQSQAAEAGLDIKVTPSVSNMFDQVRALSDLRDISIEDILGREPITMDLEAIGSYIRGKKILVTGAGGSIGSELCVQLSRFRPGELMMLDRDETGLQGVQLKIAGHGLLDTNEVILADIRDGECIAELFEKRRPEIVFHAAALKHLPMLEQYPEEGWKTNVLGTLNVLQAASNVNVEAFVNISTDKAADPTSVLGYSKRLAERLTSWMGTVATGKYLSVRFGNVIGSRGSMLPTFAYLIDNDEAVTVTHPEATRYFMTIPEACQLVLQAGSIGKTGEVLILDMGEPVKILDIAKRMIEISGKDLPIKFTGLRPGEKLHEVLVAIDETTNHQLHPKISQTKAYPLAPEELQLDIYLAKAATDTAPTV